MSTDRDRMSEDSELEARHYEPCLQTLAVDIQRQIRILQEELRPDRGPEPEALLPSLPDLVTDTQRPEMVMPRFRVVARENGYTVEPPRVEPVEPEEPRDEPMDVGVVEVELGENDKDTEEEDNSNVDNRATED